MDKIIYMDNAATTKVSNEVLEEMFPFFQEYYCNPSAFYHFASEGKKAIDKAREQAAALIGAGSDEIYFTSGGTESDNWALKAVAKAYEKKGHHIITSKIEHHAILHTCHYLEENGYEVTYLDVDEYGMIRMEELEKAIRPDTILISVMAANNEIGTIEPIARIGKLAHEKGVLFHTDAVQAYGHIPMDVEAMNIDLLSASGHKFHGPKGVGILYVRKSVKLLPVIHGGAQEKNRRAGTYNVPGIVGFGRAAELAGQRIKKRMTKETELRDYLIKRVIDEIPYARLNGHRTDRLPGNAHFCFRFIEGESMLILLDQLGVCASSGSACTSGALDPSHVLLAIGLPHELAHGSLRLTVSEDNSFEEINFVVHELKKIIERLRSMSPLYEDFLHQNQ